MLFMEGGYYDTHQGAKYWWIDPPTNEEIQNLVKLIAMRVIRYLKKHGYFNEDSETAVPEEDMDQELLPELQAASVKSKIAVGERRGQWVRRIGTLGFDNVHPVLTGHLCAQITGFSLHAAVYCAPWERAKLEKLVRYVARPAVAEKRLTLQSNGDVIYKLKTKYSDGTTHLRFSGVEFIEKLAALVPPPRIHLIRFFGVLAPHSKIRAEVVPKKDKPEETCEINKKDKPRKSKKYKWAELLARTFNIDTKHCNDCGAEMKIIAAIMETKAIKDILTHLKLPHKPPDLAPSRIAMQIHF